MISCHYCVAIFTWEAVIDRGLCLYSPLSDDCRVRLPAKKTNSAFCKIEKTSPMWKENSVGCQYDNQLILFHITSKTTSFNLGVIDFVVITDPSKWFQTLFVNYPTVPNTNIGLLTSTFATTMVFPPKERNKQRLMVATPVPTSRSKAQHF